MDEKYRERVVTLFTTSELERIDRFRKAQGIRHRSEMFRHAVMHQVEVWERAESKAEKAAAAV